MSENAKFTVAHAERIAEKLRDDLDHDLDAIASNDGHVSVYGWGRRPVAELTDAEVSAFLCGLRSLAMAFGDWLGESGVIEYERHSDGRSDLYPIRKHAATCEQIDEDIAGAEGECFHRRRPEKHAFPGRLRKYNETIARIRQFRVDLAAEYTAGLLSREKYSLQAASDRSHSWASTSHYEISRWLSKQEHSTAGLTEEQRAAWHRTKAELHALERVCKRVRDAYSKQIRQESDTAFRRAVA